MIVAVIALVVATTGGAVAAFVVTGANIKNGSVTGLDIKNGSVGSADITNNSLKSADVRNGTLDVADLSAAAVASLRAPQSSTAAFHVDSGSGALGWNNLDQVVASLSLPAGNYVLLGKVRAENDAPVTDVSVTCTLALGGAPVDTAAPVSLAGGTPGDREYVPLSGRGSLAAAGSATITCNSGPLGKFVDSHIEAIQVGSLP